MATWEQYWDLAGLLGRAVKRRLPGRLRSLREKNRTSQTSVAVLAEGCHLYLQDYLAMLGCSPDFLRGKKILELGTGEHVGTPLLMALCGARVFTIDAYDTVKFDREIMEMYRLLAPAAESSSVDPGLQEVIEHLYAGRHPAEFSADSPIQMQVVGAEDFQGEEFDLVVSRAVLEHVADLEAVVAMISRALAPGGLTVHKVDFSSHDLV